MATNIDANYLKTTFDYDIKNKLRGKTTGSSMALGVLFGAVYDEMVVLVTQSDVTVKTAADMEARLDTPEKQAWFRKAQGYQLVYEMETGKNTLFAPESFDTRTVAFDWCRDTLRIIRHILGFNQPTLFTAR